MTAMPNTQAVSVCLVRIDYGLCLYTEAGHMKCTVCVTVKIEAFDVTWASRLLPNATEPLKVPLPVRKRM
jgi:hypothetical protein